jgi:hypothetical protein
MKMQQTKSYWRIVAVAGVVGACLASACVVTTSTDDGSGGATSTAGTGTSAAGSPSAGASAGGTAGISGSSSVAGASSGGSATASFECDPDGGAVVGTSVSCMTGATNECSKCVATSCCAEFGACYAKSPGNQCGYGGPTNDGQGEFSCIQACAIAATSDGGVLDDSALETCANGCVTPTDSSGAACSAAIGIQTNDLVGCVNTNCSSPCFGT